MASEKRILLVDDDEDIRLVAELALERTKGWDVITAANGEDALRAAKAGGVSAILLDVMMPGMDGAAVFTKLKSDPVTAGIPVVLLTAKAWRPNGGIRGVSGVAGAIAKPFDPMTLGLQVTEALGWAEDDSP